MKDKKVIFLISSSIMGGAQVYIANLIEAIKDKYEVLLICPNGYLPEIVRKKSPKVKIIETKIGLSNIRNLKKIFDKEITDNTVINAHLLGTGFYSCLALKNIKNKLIVTLHQPILYEGINFIKRIMYPHIIKRMSRRVDSYISVSNEIKDSLRLYTDRECVYIANAVPDISPKKDILDVSQKDIINIGIIGRLTEQKNHFVFLDAAKEIRKKKKNTSFYIIGDGELREELKKYCCLLELDDCVYFVGAVNNPFDWMRKLDILVFSSDFEGIPLTMLESMSVGLPIVSTDVGGVPDVIVNGKNGILVPAKDSIAISDSVISLIEDDKLYTEIQETAISFIKSDLDYETNIAKYIGVIDK